VHQFIVFSFFRSGKQGNLFVFGIFAVYGGLNSIVAAAIREGNASFVVLNSARLLWVQYCGEF
jgi:hypothetical protein